MWKAQSLAAMHYFHSQSEKRVQGHITGVWQGRVCAGHHWLFASTTTRHTARARTHTPREQSWAAAVVVDPLLTSCWVNMGRVGLTGVKLTGVKLIEVWLTGLKLTGVWLMFGSVDKGWGYLSWAGWGWTGRGWIIRGLVDNSWVVDSVWVDRVDVKGVELTFGWIEPSLPFHKHNCCISETAIILLTFVYRPECDIEEQTDNSKDLPDRSLTNRNVRQRHK